MSTVSAESTHPFDPDGVAWTPISPKLTTVRQIGNLATTLVLLVPFVVLTVLTGSAWFLAGAAVALVLGVWMALLVPRQVRAWGYAERQEDLLIRKGVMFRSLVVVPYGRMQYVDVQAGPVDRQFGIAKVQLHTASAGSDAAIPGLTPEEAARLRDRLASRGEARLAGL